MICDRCSRDSLSGSKITINDKIYLCDSCFEKLNMFLSKNDYEYIRDSLTRTGYENDIEPHDDEQYFILNTYGNRVAVEFVDGEFDKITEA